MISGAIIESYGGTWRVDAPRRSASGHFGALRGLFVDFQVFFDSCRSSCICVVRNAQANFKS